MKRYIAVIVLVGSVLTKLHTPVIYIMGGPTDIAYANGMDDFKKIDTVPVMVANLTWDTAEPSWSPTADAPHRSP